MKGVFVILDGVADDTSSKLNDKTPLDYAKTPNLDLFAHRADIFNCFPIAQGIAPQSSSGIVSLLGGDYRDYPRGFLEAVGAGVTLGEGDLALRVNFATIDNINNMNLIDRRVGRTLTNKEAIELTHEINSKLKLPYKFELIHTIGHRGVLIFRGALSQNITNVDPSYEAGLSVEQEVHKVELSKPTDDSKKSVITADLLNTFIRKSYVLLENHAVNIKRKKKGYYPANFLLCRDPGVGKQRTKKLDGIWMGFGYMPLEIGVAKVFGMRISTFPYPAMNTDDFYAHSENVLGIAMKKAIEMMETQKDIIDYFYIHFKETDLPGHDNKPLQKVKFIEMIDKYFFANLKRFADIKLVVTADHTTSCRMRAHSSKPVPVLFYDSKNLKEFDHRFTEKDAQDKKTINGRQLLTKTLLK
jgi:2,3-bisphosphoglycerate-independent phosphoglycerate mutase